MDEKESLGSYLKKERELRNISLRDVARNTRVREPLLQALEEDRLDRLPSLTVAKGFLQSYAKYVGLDTNEVLLRFQTLLKRDQAPPQAEPPRKAFHIKTTWWMAGGALLAALFALVLILFSPYDSRPPLPTLPPPSPKAPSSQPETKGPAPAPASKAPPPAAMEKAAVAAAPPAVATPQTQERQLLSLELKAVERTWLNIRSSEKPEKDVILQPGENLSLQDAQRFELRVGNAGGLHVIFNGKPLEKFGKSGEVVTLVFSPQRVEMKGQEKPKPAE